MRQGFFILLLAPLDICFAATIERSRGQSSSENVLDSSVSSLTQQESSAQHTEAAGRTAIIRSSGEIDVKKPVKALPVSKSNAEGDSLAKATVGLGGMKASFSKEGKYLDILSQKFPYEKKVVQIPIGKGRGTGLCLDAKNNDHTGSPLQLYKCAGGKSSNTRKIHQEFVYDDRTGRISNFKSGLCLEAPQRNTEGSKVRLWPCYVCSQSKDVCAQNDHYQGQMWNYDYGLAQIRLKEGLCLRTKSPTTSGARVILWGCDGVDQGQHFGMLKVGGPVK